jgi:cytochrome c556
MKNLGKFTENLGKFTKNLGNSRKIKQNLRKISKNSRKSRKIVKKSLKLNKTPKKAQTWIKDDDRLETRQLHLIDVESLNLQTQLGHDPIEYLHDARLHCHISAECVVDSEAHLLRLY